MPGIVHTVKLSRVAASGAPYKALLMATVAVVIVACGSSLSGDSGPRAGTSETPVPGGSVDHTAEATATLALKGLTGWANSEPFTIGERTSGGDVVLVDFWTYTCVNCIRTFPFLAQWHDKYADAGLTILGVHTPEFEFEKAREGVLKALDRFGLEYPVAQDNARQTWNAFENHAWPAKYLFNSRGELVYEHIGEGDYRETEEEIRSALIDAGHDISAIAIGSNGGPSEDEAAYYLTEELYAGYSKVYGLGGSNSIAQVEYYHGPDRVVDYVDDAEFHHFNKIYLRGLWLNEKDAIVHARVTTGLEDYLYAQVFARSANVVLEHRGDAPIDVYVELDGAPVPRNGAGPDIVYDKTGASLLHVDESRLYALLEMPEFGQHELVLRSNSDQFAVSSYTFGNYLRGP
ncbi:MAG: redoxin domain-containing protein [Dehalococcoidia bacterium]|jgi:thiol-disulfide isomerase/thioredoxin|nr:redoxin domain-containing protein [Dehalococcoidia bacterium]